VAGYQAWRKRAGSGVEELETYCAGNYLRQQIIASFRTIALSQKRYWHDSQTVPLARASIEQAEGSATTSSATTDFFRSRLLESIADRLIVRR
jgi:hypothetical protein